ALPTWRGVLVELIRKLAYAALALAKGHIVVDTSNFIDPARLLISIYEDITHMAVKLPRKDIQELQLVQLLLEHRVFETQFVTSLLLHEPRLSRILDYITELVPSRHLHIDPHCRAVFHLTTYVH